jgi:hypothetical protein
MRFSHSKMQCCINNPADYYLNYKVGMHIKEKAPYFAVGSAMHWGFENNTEDLTEWFQENGTFEQRLLYSQEQEQAEAMCHGYFHNKDKIMDEVLRDYETGQRVKVIEEFHELELSAKIKSIRNPEIEYDFMGIIDLLFLTDKGFIIEDYKSSRDIPDFEHYLDQLYRYKYLLNYVFPDVPIYKIGIINIVKSQIKKLKTENDIQFRNRWKTQYEPYPNHLINVHQFEASKLDEKAFEEYVLNFRRQADLVTSIDENNLFFINYQNAKAPYKSEYYDIYFNEPNAYLDFNIKDTILDPDSNTIVGKRDCVPSDMEIINKPNVMYKYEQYEKEKIAHIGLTDEEFDKYIHDKFVIDDDLLALYKSTFDFVRQKK